MRNDPYNHIYDCIKKRSEKKNKPKHFTTTILFDDIIFRVKKINCNGISLLLCCHVAAAIYLSARFGHHFK